MGLFITLLSTIVLLVGLTATVLMDGKGGSGAIAFIGLAGTMFGYLIVRAWYWARTPV